MRRTHCADAGSGGATARDRVIVKARGADLSVVDFGGTGHSVLLLHGLAGRATEWRATAAWMKRRFRVVAFDQRGHGASTKGCRDFSRDAYVSDAVTVIHGYWLGRPFWGRGIMTDAAQSLAEYALHEIGLRRLESSVLAPNAASVRVLEKPGSCAKACCA